MRSIFAALGGLPDWLRREGIWPAGSQSRAARASAGLGLAVYASVVGLVVIQTVLDARVSSPPVAAFAAPMMLFYLLQIARMTASLIAWPERRTAMAVLLVAVVLFAIGGVLVGVLPSQQNFPNVTEVIFLPPYAALAAFLLLDVGGRRRMSLPPFLEAFVIAGGVACVAAVGVLTPVASAFPALDGLQLLLLLVYPMLAVAMLIMVLGDVALGLRPRSVRTWAMAAGLALLTVADGNLLRSAATGASIFGPEFAVFWGGGLALIVAGGVGPRPVVALDDTPERSVVLPVLAASAAVAVLAGVDPARPGGPWLAVLAVSTLVAAGARMVLALREAQGAAEAYRLSRTDELTGLPNRRAVVAAATRADESDEPLGLLLADLDGFKQVNDTLGHPAGDDVLRLVGRRLRAALPSSVLVARLGGDEFALVLPVSSAEDALAEAAYVRGLIARPIEVLGHSVTMDASIGIAVRTIGAADGPDLLRRADIAMYQAKAQGSGALLYAPERDEFTPERLRRAEDLRRGIPAGQLEVFYQPQVLATTHALAGLEALVRWNHPTRGLLAPGEFLSVARQAGLMGMLTEAVIEGVLNDLATSGIQTRVSFNVAPAELLNAPLMDRLLTLVDEAALLPGTLVLEVTEDSLLADPERARQAVDRIRSHHVEVAIDDYGSGYSSLAYLRDLPAHELKMDRSFVSTVVTDPRSRIIVASTAQMAHGLALRTVAEGVEDLPTAQMLASLGVDVLQGYYFAKPMPLPGTMAWIAAHNSAPIYAP